MLCNGIAFTAEAGDSLGPPRQQADASTIGQPHLRQLRELGPLWLVKESSGLLLFYFCNYAI